MKPLAPAWEAPPPQVELESEDVHVWLAVLDQHEWRVPRLARLLSTDERRRAERYRFRRDRERFIVRRGLLRTILGRYVRMEPKRLVFEYGPRGKPALSGPLGGWPRFNLSHSEGLALYAITCHREIGVDLELIRFLPEAEAIAGRFFSQSEGADWRALPRDQQAAGLFNCWTRKEAFLKAIGDGLARSLGDFDVSLAPGEPARLRRVATDLPGVSHWRLIELAPPEGWAGALVVKGVVRRIHCWTWTDTEPAGRAFEAEGSKQGALEGPHRHTRGISQSAITNQARIIGTPARTKSRTR